MNRNLEQSHIDKLVELAKDMPPEPIEYDETDISTFIKVMSLRRGRKKFSFKFLYDIYLLWSPNPERKALFGQRLSARFRRKKAKYDVFYYLKG